MKLAINGGTPVRDKLPGYNRWPVGGQKEKDNLLRALNSGTWGLGGAEKEVFTERYTRWCGAGYGLPVANGTLGLELILRGLGIGRGDEVILPPYTFVATVSAVLICGAVPVFADIEPDTFLLDIDDAERRVTPRTRAIIAVHLAGRVCDMDRLAALCGAKGLALIGDAAQAHGSSWGGTPAAALGTAASYSFQASKNLPCGEGGFVTTNDEALYKRMWGINHNGREYGNLGYYHPVLGINARMGEWQAAVLNAQLDKVPAQLEKRMENAAYLDEQLARFPFLRPMRVDARNDKISYHMYMLRYHAEALDGLPREQFTAALTAENVAQAGDGYALPIYDMEVMTGADYRQATGERYQNPKATLPCSEEAAHRTGIWMLHTTLLGERADMDAIVEAVGKIAENRAELGGQ